MSNAYKKVRISRTKVIDEHRLVMQQHLGRELTRDEHVHHLDGDKSNNDLSNLVVLNGTEHRRTHALKGEYFGGIKIKQPLSERKHPSIQMYREGCRCEGCKELNKLRAREYRAKNKLSS